MAPNSPKEEAQQTPSPNQSSTQESPAVSQEVKPKAKPKAKAPAPGVTQDDDQHYTIR